MPPTTREYKCCKCLKLIGERRGDTLIYKGLQVHFNRSRPVTCPHCGETSTFKVQRATKVLVKSKRP